MDARELLRTDASFIADTSAWWRIPALPHEFAELLERAILADRLLITPIVRMEILYSARSSTEYLALEPSSTHCESCATTAPSPTPR